MNKRMNKWTNERRNERMNQFQNESWSTRLSERTKDEWKQYQHPHSIPHTDKLTQTRTYGAIQLEKPSSRTGLPLPTAPPSLQVAPTQCQYRCSGCDYTYYNYDDEVDGQLHMRTAYLPPLSSCKSNCCYGCVELLARSSFVGVDVPRRDCYRCSFMDSWMDCRRLIDSLRWNDIPWWHTTIPFSFCLPSQRMCASV